MTQVIYVSARSVLLDALEALAAHRSAVIVIGAQAVYLRTQHVDLSGAAPYTTDADLALDPRAMHPLPALEQIMSDAGFTHDAAFVGTWSRAVTVDGLVTSIDVDLLVPEALVDTPGRRGAHLAGHAVTSARRTIGLEAVLVDNDVLRVAALDAADTRQVDIAVAGSAALLVAKLHKIAERSQSRNHDRLHDKDAADVYRLFQATPIGDMVRGLRKAQASNVAEAVTSQALSYMATLFGRRGAVGVQMATRALTGVIPDDTLATVITQYVGRVQAAVQA